MKHKAVEKKRKYNPRTRRGSILTQTKLERMEDVLLESDEEEALHQFTEEEKPPTTNAPDEEEIMRESLTSTAQLTARLDVLTKAVESMETSVMKNLK